MTRPGQEAINGAINKHMRKGNNAYPVSAAGACMIAFGALRIPGVTLHDLSRVPIDLEGAFKAAKIGHTTLQGRTGRRVELTDEQLRDRLLAGQQINRAVAAQVAIAAATGVKYDRIRLVTPADPEFAETETALQDPNQLMKALRRLEVGSFATETAFELQTHYQNSLVGIQSKHFSGEGDRFYRMHQLNVVLGPLMQERYERLSVTGPEVDAIIHNLTLEELDPAVVQEAD